MGKLIQSQALCQVETPDNISEALSGVSTRQKGNRFEIKV